MTDKSLKIGRYKKVETDIFSPDVPVPAIRKFTGWIEPADRKWIIFLNGDGDPALYWADREPSGAVIGAPVVLDEAVAEV